MELDRFLDEIVSKLARELDVPEDLLRGNRYVPKETDIIEEAEFEEVK